MGGVRNRFKQPPEDDDDRAQCAYANRDERKGNRKTEGSVNQQNPCGYRRVVDEGVIGSYLQRQDRYASRAEHGDCDRDGSFELFPSIIS